MGLAIGCIKVRVSGGSCKAIMDLWTVQNTGRRDGCVACQPGSTSACLTYDSEVWMSPNFLAQRYTLCLVHRPTSWLVPQTVHSSKRRTWHTAEHKRQCATLAGLQRSASSRDVHWTASKLVLLCINIRPGYLTFRHRASSI